MPKIANDKQARIGCKGKNKYWYGFKKHVSVDMQIGLINKVAITPANITDDKGLKHLCPNQWAIYADKACCTKSAKRITMKKCCNKQQVVALKESVVNIWFENKGVSLIATNHEN